MNSELRVAGFAPRHLNRSAFRGENKRANWQQQNRTATFNFSEMRDNHEGMPEIVDAFKDDEQYFGVLAIEINGVSKKFRFGVSRQGYLTLKRVLQLRPFDMMPGLKHHYYFAGGSFRLVNVETLELGNCEITIRVEQDKNGKEVSMPAPKELMQNLNWAKQMKDFSEAAHLPEVE